MSDILDKVLERMESPVPVHACDHEVIRVYFPYEGEWGVEIADLENQIEQHYSGGNSSISILPFCPDCGKSTLDILSEMGY